MMYRRILVPIDGSATSMLGLRHAIGMAADGGAHLRVVNVVDVAAFFHTLGPHSLPNVPDLLDSMRATGLKALEDAVKLAQKSGVDPETNMIDDHAAHVSDAILKDARRWRADLIVMGTHGRRGLNRLLLGSDAERVLRDSPVPVLLVRSPAPRKRTGRSDL